MKTLLIWDQFGEADLSIYVLEDAPEWLPKCHEKFLNSVDEEEIADLLTRVSDALCENPEYYGNKDDELAGAWVDRRVDLAEAAVLDLGGQFRIVVCGFVP